MSYQAPPMYMNPVGETDVLYNMLMIDFRCDTDSAGTFFNMHYYKLTGGPNGYAGFNSGTEHRLLFSLWELNGVHPEIEYVSPWTVLGELVFSNEGNGKHIKTKFNWEVGSWYTMCINAVNRCGKTFFSQWIRKQGDSNWLLCGILSLPFTDKFFASSSMFMEDVQKNNNERKCSLTNYMGRRVSNSTWKSWNQYIISNKYYLPAGGSATNQSLDCEYGTNSTGTASIWIRSGGESPDAHVSHGQQLPSDNPPITIAQNSTPYSTPVNAPLVPRFIQSKYSNKYLIPNNSNQVVQDSSIYHWVFEDTNDGYYYILNKDKTKAITVGSDGLTVSMDSFSGGNSQKWTKKSYSGSTSIYISPCNYPAKCLGITGSSTADGAVITLKTYSTSTPDLELYTRNTGVFKTVKNLNSAKYIAPSSSKIIQRGLAYRWIFVPVDDEYYYIITQDCLNAITISGTNEGDDLSFSPFVIGSETQMWKILDAGNDTYYLAPKNAPGMGMVVENQSTSTGAFVQIETRNASVSSFKWILTDIVL